MSSGPPRRIATPSGPAPPLSRMPYACICAKPSRYHGSSASPVGGETIANCRSGHSPARSAYSVRISSGDPSASRKTHRPQSGWSSSTVASSMAPDDSVGTVSPKTLTGVELVLDDGPARDSELFLVDGNNLAYRAYFALPEELATTEGFPTNALLGFTNMLFKLLSDYKPKGVAVAWDTRPTHRHAAA